MDRSQGSDAGHGDQAPLAPTHISTLIGLAAVVHGLLLFLYYSPTQKVLVGDERFYLDSAARLLAGDPAWHLDLLWPSLYPQLLAGIIAIFGTSLIWIQLGQTVLLLLCAAVLYDLTARLTGSRLAAGVAAAWTLGYPPLVAHCHYLWPELPHLFLLLSLLWILTVKRASVVWAVVAGAALGLALLAKSLLGPFAPLIIVAMAWGRPWPAHLRSAAVCALVCAAMVLPVMYANYQREGVCAIADSVAFNMLIGLNDTQRRSFDEDVAGRIYAEFISSGGSFAERNQWARNRVRDELASRRLGEIAAAQLGRQYFRLLDKDSFLTSQLPGEALSRRHLGYVAAPPPVDATVRLLSYLSYGVLLITGPLGFAVWRFRHRIPVRLLVAFLVYNLAIFFLFHVKSRFRIQLLPILFIGSGCAAAWLQQLLSGKDTAWPPRWTWIPVSLTICLLLLLAFARPLL